MSLVFEEKSSEKRMGIGFKVFFFLIFYLCARDYGYRAVYVYF